MANQRINGRGSELWLSRLELNASSREAMRDVSSPYEMHRTLLRAFENNAAGAGMLYRVDGATVIVQSHECPDWKKLPDGYVRRCHTKPAAEQLDGATSQVGRQFKFRLRANTARRPRFTKCYGLRDEDKCRAWCENRLYDAGVRVVRLDVNVESDVRHDHGKSGKMTHASTVFTGVVQVVDPDALQSALRSGIGRAKSFGFGLLSLAPAGD